VKQIATTVGLMSLLLVVIVLAEAPPVRELAGWIDARRTPLLIAVAVLFALGFALFMGGILRLLMDRDEPLSHEDVEDVARSVNLAARPVFARATRYRIIGKTAGRGGSDSFSLRELKAAWCSGAISRDPVWRRRAVTTAGALLLVTGILALLVVVGPPWLKLGGIALFAFVFGRLALGWVRARPADGLPT
jgi:hypothetical protein